MRTVDYDDINRGIIVAAAFNAYKLFYIEYENHIYTSESLGDIDNFVDLDIVVGLFEQGGNFYQLENKQAFKIITVVQLSP